MQNSWLSLLPFLIVIPMAIWLKEILPGLVLGLLAGAYIVQPTLVGGLQQAVNYIIQTLVDPGNVKIISFLYLFGALVGMMQIAGGIKGFVEWMGTKVKSEKAIVLFIWLTIPFTFFAPMFRIMMIGPVIKSILGRIHLPKEKVGYTLDVSTEPIIVLLPVATAFVGFMTSVVAGAMEHNKISGSAYHMFLASLPFNFFAILALLIGIATTLWSPKGKTAEAPAETEEENHLHRLGIKKELSLVKGQPWNLIFPLIMLLVLTILLLLQDGWNKGAKTWFEALSMADATFVMLLAIFAVLILTMVFYLVRRQPLHEVIYHFFDGGNQLMMPIILLILVWSVSMAAEDLGFSAFVSSTLGSFLPGFTVPAITFLVGSFVSYFIGTSWGAWGLFMPLGVTLAVATGGPVAMTVGAVFASGTFGAFASPLGDTTITTASIMEMDLMRYARYKLKISLICAGIAFLLYLGAAYFTV